jgi:RecJ-like exonuclease
MTEFYIEERCGSCYGTGEKGAAQRCPVCWGTGKAKYLRWEKLSEWINHVNSTLFSLEERLEKLEGVGVPPSDEGMIEEQSP